MKTQVVGRAGIGIREIERMEALLQATLQLVEPRPQYVGDLGQRLAARPDVILVKPKKQAQKWAWTAFGVLSGAVILVVGARAVWGLIESMGGPKNLLPRRRARQLTPAG